MTSTIARAAYPEGPNMSVGVRYKQYALQKAFDRGAVLALRAAAQAARNRRDYETGIWLDQFADSLEAEACAATN